jgi:hypothetical protein
MKYVLTFSRVWLEFEAEMGSTPHWSLLLSGLESMVATTETPTHGVVQIKEWLLESLVFVASTEKWRDF